MSWENWPLIAFWAETVFKSPCSMISLDVYNNKALITIRGGRVCQGNHFGKMLDGASFTLSPDSPPGYCITHVHSNVTAGS